MEGMGGATSHDRRQRLWAQSLMPTSLVDAPASGLDARPPTVLDAVAWLLVVAALTSLTLIRVELTDTPWHLATAREAAQTGQWPRVNTFSYTHPEYPVYQQYPVYQSILYGVYQRAGWEGLSVLHWLAWVAIVGLLIVWGGGFRKAATYSWLWAIVMLGLQRRMTLRPDLGTLICVLGLAIAIDGYERRPWLSSGLMVAWQWIFANTHQLYPIGLAMLGAYWCELWCRQIWQRRRSRSGGWSMIGFEPAVSMTPATVAVVGALIACLGTPLGWEIVKGPAHTLGSLSHHRAQVEEFARAWTRPYDLTLALVFLGFGLAGLIRRRRRLPLFELLFVALACVLAVSAVRGMPFLVVAGMGSYARSLRPRAPRPYGSIAGLSFARAVGVTVACLIATVVLNERVVARVRGLGGSQLGVGKALGAWPDHAIAFVRANTPTGPVLNLTWYTGNALIWELYPQIKVFVDPRFEAYPRPFLLDAITAVDHPELLDQLIATHRPGWMFLDTAFPGTHGVARRLVEGGRWALVYADTRALVLVSVDQNPALAGRFSLDLSVHVPPDLDANDDIAALQWIRWAGLMRAFELGAREQTALEAAGQRAGGHQSVQRALAAYPSTTP